MTDVEIMVVIGLVVLVAVGIGFMLAPGESTQDLTGLVMREVEPKVGEENQLIDFRYSVRPMGKPVEIGASNSKHPPKGEALVPEVSAEDDRIADVPPEWPGDEVFYLAATEEVDGDQRQPGLWAKVMALNGGDERRARFHYIRLRVAQIISNQPARDKPEITDNAGEATEEASDVAPEPVLHGEAVAEIETPVETEAISDIVINVDEADGAGSHGVETFFGRKADFRVERIVETEVVGDAEQALAEKAVPRLQDVVEPEEVVTAEPPPEVMRFRRMHSAAESGRPAARKSRAKARVPVEVDPFAPILNQELVSDIVRDRRAIGRLIRSANLLRDFSVCQYVTRADICKTAPVQGDEAATPLSFFESFHHRVTVDLGDSLQRFDPGVRRSYLISRQFPHQIELDFFDEALVITILPRSPQMEFLVLMPGSGLEDPFAAGFLASSRITELFMAAASENENPLTLYIELDLLLERLRIG